VWSRSPAGRVVIPKASPSGRRAASDVGALPAPGDVVLRMLGSAFGVGTLAAVLILATSAGALPLRDEELLGVARLLGVVVPTSLLVLAVAATFAMRSSIDVYRVVLHRMLERESPPPSGAAVRDTFAGPARATGIAAVVAIVVCVLDAAGWVELSSLPPGRREAVALLCCGVLQSGLFTIAQSWRATLWRWLAHLPPSDVYGDFRRTLAWRFAARVTSAYVLLGCAVLSVVLAYLSVAGGFAGGAHERLVFVAGAIVTVVIGAVLVVVLALRLGHLIARDVTDLTTWVQGFTEGSGWSGELVVEPPRGEMRTVQANELAERVSELGERYARLAAVEADARRSIQEAQRLKTRFMAFMSHDLRSPLNSITGFADILEQELDGPLNRDQKESVVAIRQSGADLLRLVTDIVDSARLDAGKLKLDRRWARPDELVYEAVTQAKDLVRGRPLRFELDVARDLPDVFVDRERFVQALTGVLFHVVRMVRQGGVRIRVHRAESDDPERALGGAYMRVEVAAADLPSEDTQRIFVAFREIKRPSGVRVGGLGLGLYLARSLVLAHGGDIVYDKREGARFVFAIPLEAGGIL